MLPAFVLMVVLGAQRPAVQHARVSVVAEQTALVPGQENFVGLKFDLDPGWHIFWQNPGDAGAPPKIDWKLPAGYSAGTLMYPAPKRIQSESFTIYGYERSALLIEPIRVPKDAGSRAEIAANVRFILCSDICIPAQTTVSATVPIGAAAASPSKALFDKARAEVPKPAPPAWSAHAEIGKTDVVVTLVTGRRTPSVEFFPLDPGVINDSALPKDEPTDRGVRIHLKRSDQLEKVPSQLPFVVKLPDGRAYTLTATVAPAK